MERGSNKSETIRWLISHTWDGTNTITPREIIHTLLELRRLQIEKFAIGRDSTEDLQLFERGVFKDALIDVSRARMEQTIFSEYNSQKSTILKLSGKRATNPIEKLAEYLGEDVLLAARTVEKLVEIGILRKIKFQNLPYFEVPFIYRPYLDSIQGRGDIGTSTEDEEEMDQN